MLRKLSMLGALVVVAVSFGVGTATAARKPWKPGNPPTASFNGGGFSDGRD
jgi:hypothetical protein